MRLKNREVLRDAYSEIRRKWPNNTAFVFDENGYVVDINSYACDLLNIFSSTQAKFPISHSHPYLWLNLQFCMNNSLEKECEVNLQNRLMDSIGCLIKPAAINGKNLGGAIVFTGGKHAHKRPRESSLK